MQTSMPRWIGSGQPKPGPPANLSQRYIVRLCEKAYDFAMRQWEDQSGGTVVYEKFIDKMSRTDNPAELETEIGPIWRSCSVARRVSSRCQHYLRRRTAATGKRR